MVERGDPRSGRRCLAGLFSRGQRWSLDKSPGACSRRLDQPAERRLDQPGRLDQPAERRRKLLGQSLVRQSLKRSSKFLAPPILAGVAGIQQRKRLDRQYRALFALHTGATGENMCPKNS